MCRVMRTWRTEFVMVLLAGCMLFVAVPTEAQELECELFSPGFLMNDPMTGECRISINGSGCWVCRGQEEITVEPGP